MNRRVAVTVPADGRGPGVPAGPFLIPCVVADPPSSLRSAKHGIVSRTPLAIDSLEQSVRCSSLPEALPWAAYAAGPRDPHMVRTGTPVSHAREQIISAGLFDHKRPLLPLHGFIGEDLTRFVLQLCWTSLSYCRYLILLTCLRFRYSLEHISADILLHNKQPANRTHGVCGSAVLDLNSEPVVLAGQQDSPPRLLRRRL